MKRYKLSDMTRGWFAGNFSPSCVKTTAVEAGVKSYKKGAAEEEHFHKVATEITVIVSGRAQINGKSYGAGDILVISPGESAAFKALEDVTTVVVKLPGVLDDKYKGRPNRC